MNYIRVSKKNVLIIGHCRLEAAQLLKLKEVPIICMDTLTDTEVKSLRLADNKLNESSWDMELVNIELEELDDELKELTGFEPIENLEAQEDDFDTTPPVEPKSKAGDIYELGEHRILCGSATKIDDVERLMEGEMADLIVTDPPYNVAYTGKTKDALKIDNDSMDDGDFRQFLLDAFVSMFSVMKDGGGVLRVPRRFGRTKLPIKAYGGRFHDQAVLYLGKKQFGYGKARLSMATRAMSLRLEAWGIPQLVL